MNIRKLCAYGTVAALTAASAAVLATPADARLACNDRGNCWWTSDTPDWQRDNSGYYSQKWNVRIRNGERDRYERSGYHAWMHPGRYYYQDRNYDRDHDRNYDNRDYDRDDYRY